jgi:hypothetical protein
MSDWMQVITDETVALSPQDRAGVVHAALDFLMHSGCRVVLEP